MGEQRELKKKINNVSTDLRDVEVELGMDEGNALRFRAVEEALGMDEEGTAHKFRAVKGDVRDARQCAGKMEEALEMNADGKSEFLDGLNANYQTMVADLYRNHERINALGVEAGFDDGKRAWQE